MKKDIIGVDLYNCAVTNDRTSTIWNSAADSEHIPTVIEKFDRGGASNFYDYR